MTISSDIMVAFESQWMMTSVLVMFHLQRSGEFAKGIQLSLEDSWVATQ